MTASDHPSRRMILGGALAAGSLAFPSMDVLAQELAPTPQCHDGDQPTERQIEGPFYKPSSPERSDLLEHGAKARVVELSGTVLTRNCKPVSRVLVDLWHADETGEYDNRGFHYRGHVFTDAAGRFSFRTIRPAPYPGRTRHYHVKVLATGRQLLTTQLYFPNEALNARDDFYSRALELVIADAGEAMKARFDFVLDLRRS
jgi:protocatechuate 3,4-dioxygenase beta subunit